MKNELIVSRMFLQLVRGLLALISWVSGGKFVGFFGCRGAICKYGENAWQTPAAAYSFGTNDSLTIDKFEVIEGTAPSYNNLADLDRLLQTITHISAVFAQSNTLCTAIAVVVKHGNPCGVSAGLDRQMVIHKMMEGDPRARFGGLVITNFVLNEELASILAADKFDGVITPGITSMARERLHRFKDKCRFIINPAMRSLSLDRAPRFRYVRGGFLVQPNYTFVLNLQDERIKKYGTASADQEFDMQLAWAIGATSNSNDICAVSRGKLQANGTGRQDRVGAAELAIHIAKTAGNQMEGAVAYSDSFFPFTDGPQKLIESGVSAILTSSGSKNDPQVIDLCVNHNVPLYMIPDAVGRGFFGH